MARMRELVGKTLEANPIGALGEVVTRRTVAKEAVGAITHEAALVDHHRERRQPQRQPTRKILQAWNLVFPFAIGLGLPHRRAGRSDKADAALEIPARDH